MATLGSLVDVSSGPLISPPSAEVHPCYYFNENYLEHCVLQDGSPCEIRLMRPSDHDLEVDLFERLSNDSRYMRFCDTRKCLSEGEIRYFTVVDQETHFALVALRQNPETGVPRALGVARFIRCTPPTTAEPAVTVTDDAQGKGLGSLLSCRLAAAARERGIERFQAMVLPNNRKAMRLMKGVGLSDPTVTQVDGELVWSIDLRYISPPSGEKSWKHWRQVSSLFGEAGKESHNQDDHDDYDVSSDDVCQVFDDDVWH